MTERPKKNGVLTPVLQTSRRYRWLRYAVTCCSVSVVALLVALWWPTPLMIVFCLSLGASLMAAALALFIAVVVLDLRHHQVV